MAPPLASSSSSTKSSLAMVFMGLVLAGASLADWPRTFSVGPTSLLGVLSLGYAFVAWILWAIRPRFGSYTTLWAGLLLAPFMVWAWVSLFRIDSRLDTTTLQNLAVMMGFLGLLMLSSRLAATHPNYPDQMGRWLMWAGIFAALVYALQVALSGFEGEIWLGARTFALFALMPLAWAISSARHNGLHKFWVFFIPLMIAASLSRLALVTALIMVGLAWLPTRGSLAQWLRFIGLIVLVSALLVGAVFKVEPLRKRFFSGDVAVQVGDVGINVMGRATFWAMTWNSYLESPWTGKGAGSASSLITSRFGSTVNHPHNDYLRILHDYGLIGFSLWMGALLMIFWATFVSWLRSSALRRPSATLHFAAWLALLGFFCSMSTDNPISYVFVMAPLAILLGASIGKAN